MPNGMTFEEIDAAFRRVDVARQQAALARFTGTQVVSNPGSVIMCICPSYKAVRALLVELSLFPLLPAAWKDGIRMFVAGMDLLCP